MRLHNLLKNFFRFWFQYTRHTLTSLFVLTGVFLVLILVFVFFQNIESALTSVGKFFQLSVYLEPSVSETEVSEIKNMLNSRKEVQSVTFISKEDAMKKFKLLNSFEAHEILSDPDFQNPLPASFEVELKKSHIGVEQEQTLSHLSQLLSRSKGVDEVSYGKSILKNYVTFFEIFYYLSLLIGLALIAGSLFIISHFVQTSLSQRREEIEILKLIGSTNWNIQKLFVFEGGFISFLAALFAGCIGFLVFSLQVSLLNLELKNWIGHFDFEYLNGAQMILFLFCGLLIGILASFFSTKRICSSLELSS